MSSVRWWSHKVLTEETGVQGIATVRGLLIGAESYYKEVEVVKTDSGGNTNV